MKRVSGAPMLRRARWARKGQAPFFSREQGRRTAQSCWSLGINVDPAPVLDVARPGGTIAETERGFGASAAAVEATAIPFARALQAGGRRRYRQAFPGARRGGGKHGFRRAAHRALQARLRSVDEAPYRRFAPFGDLVMLSTAIYPALAPQPAAFSRAVATGKLRNRLGFTVF